MGAANSPECYNRPPHDKLVTDYAARTPNAILGPNPHLAMKRLVSLVNSNEGKIDIKKTGRILLVSPPADDSGAAPSPADDEKVLPQISVESVKDLTYTPKFDGRRVYLNQLQCDCYSFLCVLKTSNPEQPTADMRCNVYIAIHNLDKWEVDFV